MQWETFFMSFLFLFTIEVVRVVCHSKIDIAVHKGMETFRTWRSHLSSFHRYSLLCFYQRFHTCVLFLFPVCFERNWSQRNPPFCFHFLFVFIKQWWVHMSFHTGHCAFGCKWGSTKTPLLNPMEPLRPIRWAERGRWSKSQPSS